MIVLNPVLYGYDETVDNAYPVVRYGEVEVNVSTINGELHAGDLVASSRVIGLGQRFEGAQSGQVLGIAVSDMEYEPTAISVDGEVVRLGRISVALQIGRQDVAVTDIAENIENDQDYIEREEFEKWLIKAGVQSEGNTFMFVRYSVGSLVTLIAFILAIRRFGGFFKESIAAVGRNPMAHQQIKSLIVWNTFMIVVIGGTGLLIGLIIMLA
ncbi:MAG: hypothetical protein KBD21_02280 [Candidatus Pacebacteria bacterium]|nr:hypothetical protein [Candidatus Paceibacterota bacterium]